MKNYKWNTEKFSGDVYVVFFVSRNKDNKDVEGFKERRKAFVTPEPLGEKTRKEFQHFVDDGVNGEVSRMYYSVNTRDAAKVNKLLVHYLIDNPNTNPAALAGKVAAIAAQKECASSKRWLFDFDCSDAEKVEEFIQDILAIDPTISFVIAPTYSNFAVVVDHRFDTRKLMEKWGEIVALKKDDLLFYKAEEKEREE